MKPNLTMALVLALGASVTGCASTDRDDDDGDGDGSNNPERPLTIEGRFAMQSEYDIVSNVPGTAGTVINYFIDATNDPDDPAKFLLEKAVEQIPPSFPFRAEIKNAIPFIAGLLNDRLLQLAPQFLPRLLEVGDAFGQVTKHFGTLETADIYQWGSLKTVNGLHFTVDGVDLNYRFSDYNMMDVRVDNLNVTLDQYSGQLTVSQHKVPLRLGQVLRIAIDEAIVPMIDPSAQNLGDVLAKTVPCDTVAVELEELLEDTLLGVIPASVLESLCNAGLETAASSLYTQLNTLDNSAFELQISGTAKGVDRNNDRRVDTIQTGIWNGDVIYAGTPAPLRDAKFFGTKN